MKKELLKIVCATVVFVCVLLFALQHVISTNRNILIAFLVIALITLVVVAIANKVINNEKVACRKS